jgi:hypothetical protein
VLICYERKILLASRWLVAGTDLVREKNIIDYLADKPAEQSYEDKLYIKIVALDAIYNFVVEKFLN